jgi:hypothetical protein
MNEPTEGAGGSTSKETEKPKTVDIMSILLSSPAARQNKFMQQQVQLQSSSTNSQFEPFQAVESKQQHSKRKRSASACRECRKAHKKCGKGRPCSRCQSLNIECVDYDTGKSYKRRNVQMPPVSVAVSTSIDTEYMQERRNGNMRKPITQVGTQAPIPYPPSANTNLVLPPLLMQDDQEKNILPPFQDSSSSGTSSENKTRLPSISTILSNQSSGSK